MENAIPTAPSNKLWGRILANSLTLSRVLVIPFLGHLYLAGAFLPCLLIMLWIDLSDVLDGFVARKLECPTVFGALLDVGADFAVLITLYCFYCIWGGCPVFLLILMAVSFGLFILVNWINKAFAKTRFGKYTGTVLYLAITLSFAAKAFYPQIMIIVNGITIFLSAVILTVSIVENLVLLYRRYISIVKSE